MAELGIIASVVQLTAAAIASARALSDLVDTIKHAPEEITAISKDTHAFNKIVFSVQVALRDPVVERVVIDDAKLSEVVEGLSEPLQNCSSVLAQLKPKIQSHLKPTEDGGLRMSSMDFKWYFKKRDVMDCRNRLEATKSTLDTALTSDVFLRAAGRDPDTSFARKDFHRKQDTDAGSALLKYAESIAPQSPTIRSTFGEKGFREEILPQELSPSSSSRSNLNPLTPPGSTIDPLERLRTMENQRTGLHNASRDGDDLIVQIMLEEGCDVNIRGADGRTALHIAVQYGHEDVTLTLLARNAEVNAMSKPNIRGTEDLRKFEAGRIPLHWAAAQGHESIVRIVLENKADVLARNATGRTALQDSIWRSHDRIAIMLLERGSAITNADNEAGTPLHEACYNGRLEVVKTLIAKGKETGDFPVMLDAITTDENRWNAFWFLRATPIFFAAITCHVDCVRYLLQCGPSNSKYGDTPLHAACVLGNLVIVQLLLDAGVDIELRDSVNTETPLLKAASTGKTEVIMYLLEQGADPMAKNPCGRNALEHARLHEPGQHPAAVELLDQWIKRCDEPKKPPQT